MNWKITLKKEKKKVFVANFSTNGSWSDTNDSKISILKLNSYIKNLKKKKIQLLNFYLKKERYSIILNSCEIKA